MSLRNNTLSVIFLIASYIPVTAWGWGQKGHDVTANIAESHLTDATKDSIKALLGNKSMVYWANWLDNASHTPKYEYSKTWHYKNIDADETFNTATLNPKGDILRAIAQNLSTLKDRSSEKQEKQLALKMIIHLMGDMHQPMHMGRLSDLGGNKHKVKFFNRETNLHTVWDTNLPESGHKWSYTEWSDQIDRLSDDELKIITTGTLEDWAKETYGIACEIYESAPEDTSISYEYIAGWTPTVEQQFVKGGVRLAHLLNGIFDSQYCGY